MSDNYIIEIRPASGITVQAGIVVRDDRGFRFFAATRAFDALEGKLHLEMVGKEVSPGVILAGGGPLPQDIEVEGPVWVGHHVQIGAGVRLMGPIVLGDGARVGDRAQLRESIVFPGTEVADESILIGAIAGHAGILQSLRPRQK